MNKKINKYYLLLLIGFVFPYVNNETGWEYVQGTQQCFYMFERIHIDGVDAIGDGQPANNYSGDCINNPYTCDVIGAFIQRDETDFGQDLNNDGQITSSADVCIGWIYASSDGFTTVPLIGAVPGDDDLLGYMEDDETPIFKIYDHDNDIILPLDINNVYYNEYLDDQNENGIWDPAYEAEPFTDIDLNGEYGIGEEFTDDNGNGIWDEGEYFYDENLSGAYDPPEPFEDLNSNGVWDDATDEEFYQDLNQNGVWDEAIYGELLGWAYNEIFIYSGSLNAYNTFGCNDVNACNYDDVATADDGSCLYSPSGDLIYETNVFGNSFELSWDENSLDGSPELNYQVIINQGSTEIYNELNAESPIQINDLDWSTTYSIDVITTNHDICEALYTDISVTTDSMPAPGQVTLNSPISGEGEIFLSWDPVDFASTYKIISDGLLIDETSSTIYVDTQLAPNSTISYQVQAVNMEGTEGLESESVLGSTLPLSFVTLDSVVAGQGELQLSWSMENSQLSYNDENYIFDIYMDDQYLTTRYGVYHVVTNLDAGQEYCFYIVPRIELLVDGEEVEFTANESEELCGTPEQVSGWFVHITAELDAWNQELVYDNYNTMGMSPDASDGHDPSEDIPEPPVSGGLDYNVSLSFPHPEWNFGIGGIEVDYFTTDIRELKDLSNRLEIWDASIIGSAPGSASLSFDFISNAGNYPIFLNWSNEYTRVYDGDQINFIYNTPEEREEFKIIVGNQPPSVPVSLEVTGGESRTMHLSWDLSIPCEDGSISCNDYSARYPATSYKVYRSWYEENSPHLIALVGTRHNKISILPSQLYAQSDDVFEITQGPSDGYLELEYFEPFIDLDFDDIYDEGEEFSDCGWDGLCPGDQGYDSEVFTDSNNNNQYDEGEDFVDYNLNGIWDENGPDIGEGDGICNVVYYYQANEYLTSGMDSLSYANGIYDYGEDYIDENGNEQWDIGEEYVDSRQLKIKISDQLDSSYSDEGLRTGTIYFYNVLASNDAGESALSMMDSEETAPNIRPIADAGLDQVRYLISSDEDSVLCAFPLDNIYDEDGGEILDDLGNPILETTNNSYDPDGLITEQLTYYWELYDPENTLDFLPEDQSSFGDVGWWDIGNDEIANITLPETIDMLDDQYLVRLYVQDVSAYFSEPDSAAITVTRDIPEPAIVSSIDAEESLYYIKLFWEASAYDSPGEGNNPPPEGYDGELELADYYVIYRDGVEYQSINSDTLFFVDSGLTPEEAYVDANEDGLYNLGEDFIDENNNGIWDSTETHCYYVEAYNGTGTLGPSDEYCYSTGELPVPIILSPTGGEILTSGEETVIEWNIVESNIQFIDTVGVYHSIDAGETWSLKESWSSSEIPISFIFEIPETDTILFYNKFKVEVLDIGDYGGDSSTKQTHADITDHLIIIANDELEGNYNSGWNLISSPLELSSTNVWDNFTGDNDDIPNFLLYSQDTEVCGFPQCDNQDFEFQVGEGFYMISQQDASLGLAGNLLDSYTIELQSGWNLIGNPLVARVLLDSLNVISNGVSHTWGDAVENQLLMPSIHGFDNQEKMHKPEQLLEPFLGYWIHASEPLDLLIEPHIYDESLYNNSRDGQFELTLYSKEHDPNSAMLDLLWCDMIKIGLSDIAQDGMIYGEDEYDIPIVVNPASFTNMYIDQPEWESSGAETNRFFSDIRLLEGPEITKTWNLAGQLLGNVLSDSISLEWELNNLDILDDHDITLVAGEEIINMREINSAIIVKEYFENMQITVGPLVEDDSCESQGLVTCEDGSCASTLEDCSCESQGLVTCDDETCAETLEDCIDLSNDLVPDEFSISNPYPNPFNPLVKFDFSLPSISEVNVSVYDINGNHTTTLLSEIKSAGHYSVTWNADSHPTGMYFIQFRSDHMIKTMKVVLIK